MGKKKSAQEPKKVASEPQTGQKTQFTIKDAGKWAAIAGLIGAILGQVLSEGQIDQIADWGDIGTGVLTAVSAALAAFLLALRKK